MGKPSRKFGAVLAGIHCSNHAEARLLARVLVKGMQDHAGHGNETVLARWHRDITNIERRATRDKWVGWEE